MIGIFLILILRRDFITTAAPDIPEPPTGQQSEIMLAQATEKDRSVACLSISSASALPLRWMGLLLAGSASRCKSDSSKASKHRDRARLWDHAIHVHVIDDRCE